MHFKRVAVEGIATIEAPHVVQSSSIEQRICEGGTQTGLSPGLIETLTGVRERRVWSTPIELSHLAAQAAEQLLTRCNIPKSRIGLLINTSVSKTHLEPSLASAVHGRLQLPDDCLNFDVSNACLAFLDGMSIASLMIERGAIDYALIVNAENSSNVLEATIGRLSQNTATAQDLRDNFATLTLGSGVAAMLLCREDLATTSHRFLGGVKLAGTEWNHLCQGGMDQMITDAAQLLKAGVALAKKTFEQAREELHWTPQSLDAVIMHQVGAMHMSTIRKQLGVEHVPAHVTYDRYGNMGPAAIPFTLFQAQQAGDIFEGDRVALMGIGSGLNCAMMEWQH